MTKLFPSIRPAGSTQSNALANRSRARIWRSRFDGPSTGATLPSIAISYAHPIKRFVAFLRIHFVGLLRLSRIVVAPQPSQRFRQIDSSLRAIVGCFAEPEVKVIALHLERIRKLHGLQQPTPGLVLDVLHAVALPDANVLSGLLADQEWINIAAVQMVLRLPLHRGVAADSRVYAAEFIRKVPSH